MIVDNPYKELIDEVNAAFGSLKHSFDKLDSINQANLEIGSMATSAIELADNARTQLSSVISDAREKLSSEGKLAA
ncbi:MAG: hypothetical protein IM613_12965 [Cytophagales bacterium]|nr:hypothetical protein [Cytophagales bacterium]